MTAIEFSASSGPGMVSVHSVLSGQASPYTKGDEPAWHAFAGGSKRVRMKISCSLAYARRWQQQATTFGDL